MAKPKAAAPSTTFSEQLRGRVLERLSLMAEDRDRPRVASEGPLAAEEIGIAYSTLWRFLYRGKGLSAGATDKVMAWLEEK